MVPRRTTQSWVSNSQSANTYRITRLFLPERAAVCGYLQGAHNCAGYHMSRLPEDNSETVRPKVAGSIAETSDVRNFLGIYEVAVRYGSLQRCIVGLTRVAMHGSTTGHLSQHTVKGGLACVIVERTSRHAPGPRTWKAYAMTAFRTYEAISRPVRSPVGNHMGIDRQRRIVV